MEKEPKRVKGEEEEDDGGQRERHRKGGQTGRGRRGCVCV